MEAAKKIDIGAVIDNSKVGAFQVWVYILCAACLIMDGYDVQALGYAAPAIIREWHPNPAEMGRVLSAALVGIAVGSLLFSMLADKIGRRPVLIVATLFFSFITIVTGFANSVNQLLAIRFIAGVGLGGIMPNAMTLVGEYSPQRLRVFMMMLVSNGFNAGAVLGGFFSAWLIPISGWRSVFFVGGAIPLAITFLMVLYLPESLQFLTLRRKTEKVGKWLRRIDSTIPATANYVVKEQRTKGAPIVHLFRDGRAVGTLLLWVINFTNLLNLYFLASWLPTVITNAGYSIRSAALVGTTLQIGGTVGTLALGWLIGRFGFIPVLGTSFAFGCISIALIGQPAATLTFLFLLVFAAGLTIVGGQGAVNTLAGTYYPTNLRSTGIGSGLGIGRLGAILGPNIAGILLNRGWAARELFYAAAVPAFITVVVIISLHWVMKPQRAEVSNSEVMAH